MRVAAIQLAPVLLDRAATLAKIEAALRTAHDRGARLAVFPEACLPGYPTWIARTGGAVFDDPLQKELYARYVDQAVELPGPELDRLQELARELDMHVVLGVVERGLRSGRGSLWCTALRIGPSGTWHSHRKLVPTYEERLVWARGDGQGLSLDTIDGWGVGALNCWENWMPAARLALYAQGEEVHCTLWPGSPGLTRDICRFVALEGRLYVIAASGVLRAEDVPADLPGRDRLLANLDDQPLHGGGSRIVSPTGDDLTARDEALEAVLVADLSRDILLGSRQNFDPSGHYGREDVFELRVDRRRRSPVEFRDG